jgi:hypothetical protein
MTGVEHLLEETTVQEIRLHDAFHQHRMRFQEENGDVISVLLLSNTQTN